MNRLVGFFLFFFFPAILKKYDFLRLIFIFFFCLRTAVDQFFSRCMKDSRPVQALSVHQAGVGRGGQGEDDDEEDDDDIEELTGVTDLFIPSKILFL